MNKKWEKYAIDKKASITDALKLMDENDNKLLLVFDQDAFLSILSIGDIQRSLLKENKLDQQIGNILRPEVKLATIDQSKDQIRELMLQFRMEFMPVLDRNKNQLHDVIFWNEIFEQDAASNNRQIEEKIPVVIMAGGKGTRLQPITNIIPKPLVPIGNRAFVEIIMDSFYDQGLNDFSLSVNYKEDMIRHYFGGLNKGYKIQYFTESKPLGTAGSLHLLSDKINNTFFVSNCDILIDEDYKSILEYHKANQNELTAIAAVKTYSIPYGTMDLGKDGLLKKLREKPQNTYYVNAGLYVLEPHLLKEIPKNEFYHITKLMEKIMERNGKVGVFPISEGSWLDIGEWNEYNKTQERFKSRFGK